MKKPVLKDLIGLYLLVCITILLLLQVCVEFDRIAYQTGFEYKSIGQVYFEKYFMPEGKE